MITLWLFINLYLLSLSLLEQYFIFIILNLLVLLIFYFGLESVGLLWWSIDHWINILVTSSYVAMGIIGGNGALTSWTIFTDICLIFLLFIIFYVHWFLAKIIFECDGIFFSVDFTDKNLFFCQSLIKFFALELLNLY